MNPPTVDQLLTKLIAAAGSRSKLVHCPAALVKPALAALSTGSAGRLDQDPEQYLIADEDCVVDVARAERELGWRPRFADDDMLLSAYAEYRRARTTARHGHHDAVASAPAEGSRVP